MGPGINYSDKLVGRLIEGIWNGTITEFDLPLSLYKAIAENLKEGLYKGYGGTLSDFSGKDFELLNELRENVYMFSAAKTFQEVKAIQADMFDENGDRVTMREFTKLGRQTYDTWNDHYGRTEYGTAVGQAQMASKWNEIEKNKDLLPTLVFDTKGNPCEECAPFEGFAAPVEDPIWNWATPLLHFNCECTLRQEEKDYALSDDTEYSRIEGLKKDVPEEFQMNPGKDGYVFSPEHPYFEVAPKDIPFAKENFGLPIPSIEEEIGRAAPITGLSLKEAQEVMKDYPVSEKEKEALLSYTGGDYNQINGYYRGLRKTITEKAEETAGQLDKFLESAPKLTTESYRGITLDEYKFKDFKNLKKGELFTDNAFMSTSYDKGIAHDFSGSAQYQVEMTIKGKSGVLIEGLSDKKTEREILFGRGSKFEIETIKVKEKEGIYGKLSVTLKEL